MADQHNQATGQIASGSTRSTGLANPSMQVQVKCTDGKTFVGTSGAGFEVVMAGAPAEGQADLGIRPMEMMLFALGGCSSYDVVSILKKSRQIVESCQVTVQGVRADAIPAIFTQVHLHFSVNGPELNNEKVERAVALSAEKYCSASLQLVQGGVAVTHSFVVNA